jgi:pimeloyl-ACP methyl ester carboxylesterase
MLKILFLIPLSLLLLYIFQDDIIYTCGSTRQTHPPFAFGLPEIQYMNPTIFFERLNANRTIYYFHGNGVSAENTFWHVGRLYQICNCSIYVMEPINCRKPSWFGYSQRIIGYELWREVKYHLSRDHENIFMGVSLGTAHALYVFRYLGLYDQKSVVKIILENPFTMIQDLFRFKIPLWFLSTNWDNVDMLDDGFFWPHVLFLTSGEDEIVPPSMSKRLLSLIKPKAKQVILSGANHGDAGAHHDYLPAIEKILRE